MSERDTHFMKFARLLTDDICQAFLDNFRREGITHDEVTLAQIQVIAQRAYDFACHVATHTTLTSHGDMSKIPDMDQWPEKITGNRDGLFLLM